jgi:hypothetical protein
MRREDRSNATEFVVYPFDWGIDPVGPTSIARRVSRGSDGVSQTGWTTENLSITDPGGYFPTYQFRDTSPMYDRLTRRYYLAVNSITASSNEWKSDRFSIWTSPDGLAWTFVTWVIAPGSPTHVWSPDFFVDDDGTVYVIASISQAAGGTVASGTKQFRYALFRCTDTATFGSWTYAGLVSGSAFPTDVGGNINTIDPFMFKRGGTYYVLWQNQNVTDPAYGTMGIGSSSSILGPYVGGAFSPAVYGEGQNLVELPAGSAHRYRIYFDGLSGIGLGAGIQYVETDDLSTVTAPAAAVDYPYYRHATVVLGM